MNRAVEEDRHVYPLAERIVKRNLLAHVAPVKKHTIPQLEFKGAIDGLDLAQRVTTDLDLNMADVVFHTDSETVLKWINTKNADKMDVGVVSNRVGKIQRATSVEQ